jgi:hypothetical protein
MLLNVAQTCSSSSFGNDTAKINLRLDVGPDFAGLAIELSSLKNCEVVARIDPIPVRREASPSRRCLVPTTLNYRPEESLGFVGSAIFVDAPSGWRVGAF